MQRQALHILCFIVIATFAAPSFANTDPTVQKEIDRSIAAFPGECPCPYSTDKSGQSCGSHSAYSEGLGNKYGYIPFCYPDDIAPIPPASTSKIKPKTNQIMPSLGLPI